MRESKPKRHIILVVLLTVSAVCLVSCSLLWFYEAGCTFDVNTHDLSVRAGGNVHLLLWQSDCVLGYLGLHACYEVAKARVEGLPPGSAVEGIEWRDCHQSELTITTQRTTPAGTYRLIVRRSGGWLPTERVTLTVLAP